MARLQAYPIIFLTAVLVYSITAYNSHGYFDTDEHFQTIELAGFKLGTHGPDDLPREHKGQLRSALLPGICFAVIKASSWAGITNPYNQAFLLRLITAALALFSIHFFIRSTAHHFSNKNTLLAYYLLSYFLWFIPFVSVRFSSETWSGLLFLLAMSLVVQHREKPINWYVFGILLGFSFLCRVQIGFLIICLTSWLYFSQQLKPTAIIKTGMGFALAFALGWVLDAWYYEEYTFTLANYLQLHIDTKGQAFGVSPWYYYTYKLLVYPGFFIGIPLVLSLAILFFKKPKNLYLWCVLSFVFIHTLVPHKEERFLIPVLFLFPIVMIKGYEEGQRLLKSKFVRSASKWSVIVVFAIANPIGIIVMGSKAAGIGRMELTQYIHENYRGKSINLISTQYANPYDPYHYLPSVFYQEPDMQEIQIWSICELQDSVIQNNLTNLLIVRQWHMNDTVCSQTISQQGFEFKHQSIPDWIVWLNGLYRGWDAGNTLLLFEQTDTNK